VETPLQFKQKYCWQFDVSLLVGYEAILGTVCVPALWPFALIPYFRLIFFKSKLSKSGFSKYRFVSLSRIPSIIINGVKRFLFILGFHIL
jgi:hypothetical protein